MESQLSARRMHKMPMQTDFALEAYYSKTSNASTSYTHINDNNQQFYAACSFVPKSAILFAKYTAL